MSATPQAVHRRIPVADIIVSQTDSQVARRRSFAKPKLEELAGSIKVHGLLHPIVVRPQHIVGVTQDSGTGRWHAAKARSLLDGLVTLKGKGHETREAADSEAEQLRAGVKYELVAGERRFLAVQIAGLADIDASVREYSDRQAIEAQLVENLHNEDLHPLHEAEGYEQLMKQHGHKADELGDKVGKSKGYVYARLKLLALCKDARAAFYDGKLTASTALLLARIPNDQLQKEALKEITSPRYGGEVMSVRDATRHIHENYMLKLGSAGFKTEDVSLVPAAGACGACPKRTGNQPQLFGDVKGADVCTDPPCFKAKLDAHAARVRADAESRGQKVISGKEAKKVAPYGADSSLQGFVALDSRDYSDNKNRTYRQILGKSFEPTLLQDPESGKMVEVAPTSAVKGSAAKGINPQTAQEKKAKLEGEYRAELFRQVRKASMARSAKLLRVELEEAASRLFDRLDHDAQRRLFKVLEWPIENKGGRSILAPPTDVNEMTDAELAQFIRDCTLAPDLYAPTWSDGKPESLEDAAADLKIDTKKIRKEIADAKKAKAAKPASSKAAPARPPVVHVKAKKKAKAKAAVK